MTTTDPDTTAQPVRVQRRRTPGWRMPANTVHAGRNLACWCLTRPAAPRRPPALYRQPEHTRSIQLAVTGGVWPRWSGHPHPLTLGTCGRLPC